jgi:A/G-specific adenine glycosylase
VLRLWAGLGYYRRARQLHAAAKRIEEAHNGLFPQRLADVLELPGIGRYTAQAILSFAFDERLGIVEANTQRLYARLLHWEEPLQSSKSQTNLWNFANAIVPRRRCGEFNQAMMEIGSQICTPKNPSCNACPLLDFCPTGQRRHTHRIPIPKGPKTYTDLIEAVVLVQNASAQWLVRRCGPKDRWSGLWDFPRFDVTGSMTTVDIEKLLRQSMIEKYQLDIGLVDSRKTWRHAVTRYRIQLLCFIGTIVNTVVREPNEAVHRTECEWMTMEDLAELPWNASGKRIVKWLREQDLQDAMSHDRGPPTLLKPKIPMNSVYRS